VKDVELVRVFVKVFVRERLVFLRAEQNIIGIFPGHFGKEKKILLTNTPSLFFSQHTFMYMHT